MTVQDNSSGMASVSASTATSRDMHLGFMHLGLMV